MCKMGDDLFFTKMLYGYENMYGKAEHMGPWSDTGVRLWAVQIILVMFKLKRTNSVGHQPSVA